MLTVIAYDITDDRRRQRVSTLLEDYGVRVNYSVFECELGAPEFEALYNRLKQLIRRRTDHVLFYRLCESCRPRKAELGRAEPLPPSHSGLVIV